MFTVEPIGYFHTSSTAPYEVPRQASLGSGNEGVIELKSGCQFEQGLEGLEGFDQIWVIYRFHRNESWKPKVLPPRGGKKQGVFATRSPHRPNFIGLSSVALIAIEGRKLFITNHDLIDGTPILDLKPYLNYSDGVPSQRQGWLDTLDPEREFRLEWSKHALEQFHYLEVNWNCPLKKAIETRLKFSPLPYPNNRVKQVKQDCYKLAYRTWRVYFRIEADTLTIDALTSGYDQATLDGKKTSRWEDVPIHQAFVQHFSNQTSGP